MSRWLQSGLFGGGVKSATAAAGDTDTSDWGSKLAPLLAPADHAWVEPAGAAAAAVPEVPTWGKPARAALVAWLNAKYPAPSHNRARAKANIEVSNHSSICCVSCIIVVGAC